MVPIWRNQVFHIQSLVTNSLAQSWQVHTLDLANLRKQLIGGCSDARLFAGIGRAWRVRDEGSKLAPSPQLVSPRISFSSPPDTSS